MFSSQMMNMLIKQDNGNGNGNRNGNRFRNGNNENIALFEPHIIAVIIMTSLNVAHIFGIIYSSYKVDSFLGISQTGKFITNYMWNLLTPGYQWLEILFIFSGIVLLYLGKLVLDEITTKINNSITNLKNQLKVKENKIVELETELKRLQYSSFLYDERNLRSVDL